MVQFEGSYHHESADGLDDYYTKLGITRNKLISVNVFKFMLRINALMKINTY
jgi:hypothetical protein